MSLLVVSFALCLLFFLGIGVYSATRKSKTSEDYLVASRNVHPWVMALSAVATNNSGFMFIGLIGETYAQGVSAMWVMVGWVLGDYLMWLSKVPERIRSFSGQHNLVTVPSVIGHGVRASKAIVAVSGLLTLVFLSLYAAAQLNAGSKALQVLFEWPYETGAILGALIVVIYCFAGGIRASIWTDVSQSIVMFVAMAALCIMALNECGGLGDMWQTLTRIDPVLTDWQPPSVKNGFVLFVLGWFFAGAGVIGQPHIMVRTMTLDSAANMGTARRVYFAWNALFAGAAILVGLAARAYLDGGTVTDPELALPILAKGLLPEALVGVVLAGVFAATMSTADSQILSCSAAVTQDVFPKFKAHYNWNKIITVLITLSVLGIALGGGSVFDLIVLAWSSLAAGLGPLLFLRAFGKAVDGRLAIAMIVNAMLTIIAWRFVLELTGVLYDAMPAILVSFATYGIGQCFLPSISETPNEFS